MEAIERETVPEDRTRRDTRVVARPGAGDDPVAREPGLRFEDAYWDDAFCAWWDPTLRTCC